MPRQKKQPKRPAPRQQAPAKAEPVQGSLPVASTGIGGVISLTRDAWSVLIENRGVFIRLILVAWAALLIVAGVSQLTQYQSIKDMVSVYAEGAASGPSQAFFESGIVFLSVVSGSQSAGLSAAQQLLVGFVFLQLWLVVIWTLRHRLSGATVKVRDAVYGAGAALIPVILVTLVGLLQLLPFVFGVAVLSAVGSAWQSVAVSMVGFALVIALGIVTVYWLVSTLTAAVIVTIPGTYPMAALRSARQLVRGMRTPLLWRLLWLMLVCGVSFAIVVAMAVVVDRVTGGVGALLVAGLAQLASVAVCTFAAAYIYQLYRRVVDARS